MPRHGSPSRAAALGLFLPSATKVDPLSVSGVSSTSKCSPGTSMGGSCSGRPHAGQEDSSLVPTGVAQSHLVGVQGCSGCSSLTGEELSGWGRPVRREGLGTETPAERSAEEQPHILPWQAFCRVKPKATEHVLFRRFKITGRLFHHSERKLASSIRRKFGKFSQRRKLNNILLNSQPSQKINQSVQSRQIHRHLSRLVGQGWRRGRQ